MMKIAIDGARGWFGPIVLDRYGTPHLSELRACGAPPIETLPIILQPLC
jgi:hypothetical protein